MIVEWCGILQVIKSIRNCKYVLLNPLEIIEDVKMILIMLKTGFDGDIFIIFLGYFYEVKKDDIRKLFKYLIKCQHV